MKEVSAKKLSMKKSNLKNSAEKVVKDENRYELVEFVVRHFRIPNWKEYNGTKYSPQELIGFLNDFIELVRNDRTLCHISPPVTIVGGLNGHFQDLIRIFNIKNEKTKKEDDWKQVFATEKFVFLGDYTGDDQSYNLETVCLLFGLKMIYTNRYILLRGFEETRMTSDFQNQILTKFPGPIGEEIRQKFKTAFSMLPSAAVVGDKILCVPSGISPIINKSVEEWRKIPKSEKFENLSPVVRDLIFARPCEAHEQGADSNQPAYVCYNNTMTRHFNEAAVKDFCAATKIELIVRSHAVLITGFRFFGDKKLVTISSCSAHKNHNHKAAFLRVSKEGVVSIIQMRPTEKKEEEKKPKKKSGETGKKESAEKVKKSQETPKKGSKDTPKKDSKEESKTNTEDGTTKKKRATSKPKSKEFESLYDNLSEKK